jgi:hypothetical protein
MTYVIPQLVWEQSSTRPKAAKDARGPPMITRRQALDIEVSPPQRQDLAACAGHHIHTSSKRRGRGTIANLITRSPADRAKPPSAKAARPQEIHPWTAEELSTFLAWADAHGRPDPVAWRLLALRSPAAKTTSLRRAGATEALRNGLRVAKMLLTKGRYPRKCVSEGGLEHRPGPYRPVAPRLPKAGLTSGFAALARPFIPSCSVLCYRVR